MQFYISCNKLFVIHYRMSSMKTAKKADQNLHFFASIFAHFLLGNPLYIVVKPSYLPFDPLFVIIIIVSTWNDSIALMSGKIRGLAVHQPAGKHKPVLQRPHGPESQIEQVPITAINQTLCDKDETPTGKRQAG